MSNSWKEALHDIHSRIRVMFHSIIAFPKKDETAGSMTEKLIPEIENFISTEIIEKLIADIPEIELRIPGFNDPNCNDAFQQGGEDAKVTIKQQLRDKWL